MNTRTRKSSKSAAAETARRRRPEARPQEILDAALAVFAEKGFSATRMRDIAQRAGITVVTVYRYYKNKQEIFKSLVEESVGVRILYLTQMANDYEGPSADLMRLIIRAIGAFLVSSDRAVLPKIILAETGNFPELARFYRREVTDRGLAMFEAIIRRGIMRGEFREIDPAHGAKLMVVPVMFTAIWRASFGTLDSETFDYGGFIETHLDIILRGIAAEKAGQARP
jgi:AcrR family transcriptional regulator